MNSPTTTGATAAVASWLKQPSTIHGIAALVAAGAMAVVYRVTGSPETASTAAVSAFGLVCMAMNDNSADKSSVEKLAQDAISAIVTKRVASMLPTLSADVQGVLMPAAVQQAAPPPVVAAVTLGATAPLPVAPPAPVQGQAA